MSAARSGLTCVAEPSVHPSLSACGPAWFPGDTGGEEKAGALMTWLAVRERVTVAGPPGPGRPCGGVAVLGLARRGGSARWTLAIRMCRGWQQDREHGLFVRDAPGIHGSSVGFGQLADDGQPEPAASGRSAA